MNNTDYVVQQNAINEYDNECLRRQLFKVNMRLFHSSKGYRQLITNTIEYMEWTMRQKWDDYRSTSDGGTHGVSGANLGIPYNIIGYRVGKSNFIHVMINPIIVNHSDDMVETKSNCGSLHLKEKIPVFRYSWIVVEFYDRHGKFIKQKFPGKEGGFTIQHEVDHNNGVLITDRYIEQNEDSSLVREVTEKFKL